MTVSRTSQINRNSACEAFVVFILHILKQQNRLHL